MVVPGAGRVRCSLTSSVPVLSSLSPLESPLASADRFDDDRAAGVQCAGRIGDPVLAPLVLSQDEQHTLENWAKRRSTAQDLALRARIVLASAEGHNNIAVAARLGVSRNTVTKWQARFLASRLDGLGDEPRPGCRGRSPMPTWRRWWCAPWKGARGGHALVQTGAGQAGGDLADQRAPDLAVLRAPAAPHGGLQDLPGPAAAGQDPRRRRPLPRAAGQRRGLRG